MQQPPPPPSADAFRCAPYINVHQTSVVQSFPPITTTPRNILEIMYYHYYDINTIKVNQYWNFNWILTYELQDHKTDLTERYSYLRSPFVACNQPFCFVAEEFVVEIRMGHRNIWKGLP